MWPSARPRQRAPPWLERPWVVASITLAAVSGLWGFLTLVPVNHQIDETFTVWGSGPNGCGETKNFSLADDGSFSFNWTANTSTTGWLTLYGSLAALHASYTPYSGGGQGGGADVPIVAGVVYYFAFCGSWNQTAVASGVLSFPAPVL